MTSVQSSLDADADEVDLSGLVESIVDSDEEEDLAESMDVRIVLRDLPNRNSFVPIFILIQAFFYLYRV